MKLLPFLVILLFVLFSSCSNYKQRKLREENELLLQEYNRLINSIDSIDKEIEELRVRDSLIIMELLSDSAQFND